MMTWFRKLRGLTQRRRREAELSEELEFHLSEEARLREEDGEAQFAARRELGNLALVQEDTRATWAAHQLEFVPVGKGPDDMGLWTKRELSDVRTFAGSNEDVIWGHDIEEAQPQLPIAELASLNPDDPDLKRMPDLTKDGHNRKMAPDLLDLAKQSRAEVDKVLNDVSLRENLIEALEVEKNRLATNTKMIAQNERERVMKEQFLKHFRLSPKVGAPGKVLLRFGRNHL